MTFNIRYTMFSFQFGNVYIVVVTLNQFRIFVKRYRELESGVEVK